MAGIEGWEARINYLAYAPEMRAVMLRRQQQRPFYLPVRRLWRCGDMVKMALDR
jgi:hypothetical protein